MTTATKSVSLEQELNPTEAQTARFDLAAHKLNLDEGIWKVLRYPNARAHRTHPSGHGQREA